MEFTFVKMHGCGNDFIVADDRSGALDFSEEAVELLCDRNFGIGADGLMLLRESIRDDADFAWWFRNSDGSVAEMCGNGIRCMAKYIVDRGLIGDGDVVAIETLAGVMRVRVTRDERGLLEMATVDMGEPILEPALVPTTLGSPGEAVLETPFDVEGQTVAVTCVSMGNPHAVIWVQDADAAPVTTLGPAIETHAAFPRKTNVEFAQIVDRSAVRLRVWERGAGETLACGTGACATVVAGVLAGRLERRVTVELPGGELSIDWDEASGRVHLTGPATEVFSGVFEIEDLDEDD